MLCNISDKNTEIIHFIHSFNFNHLLQQQQKKQKTVTNNRDANTQNSSAFYGFLFSLIKTNINCQCLCV